MPRKRLKDRIVVQSELERYLHAILLSYKKLYRIPVYKLVALCVWLAVHSGELEDHFTGQSDIEGTKTQYFKGGD